MRRRSVAQQGSGFYNSALAVFTSSVFAAQWVLTLLRGCSGKRDFNLRYLGMPFWMKQGFINAGYHSEEQI